MSPAAYLKNGLSVLLVPLNVRAPAEADAPFEQLTALVKLHGTLPYRTYLPHQHSRAPEVQTTGDTTPVQQIVYAESLTISGGSNA